MPKYLPTQPSGDGGLATDAGLINPFALAVDTAGNLYIVEKGSYRVRKVSPQGIITTLAGTGKQNQQKFNSGYPGDGGPAVNAPLNDPSGLAVDRSGNIYIADQGDFVIRKVSPDGNISTFAGIGAAGYSGDGGQAANATFTPSSLASDPAGNLYLADGAASVIRKISPDGVISTFAGNGKRDFAGDGGLAKSASLSYPSSLAFDAAGNVFVADSGNNVIRKIGVNGVISTVAGNYNLPYEFSGDGGPAISATFQNPFGVTVDIDGNLFIADLNANRIREVLTTGVIVTAAGNGNYVYQGDGGPATNAGIQSPISVLAVGNNIYVSDFGHGLVRLLKPGTPPMGSPPLVSEGGIVTIFSSAQTIAAESWISIYGSNLIAGTTPVAWNGDYPLALGGTTVTVNKVPVPLSYVSPTMINAFVPNSGGLATANVVVTTANGNASGKTTFAPASPAFCLLGDGKHVAGIILRADGSGAFGGGTYDVIGPLGDSLGYPTVPAKAGENIVLFGVGFGSTNPPDYIYSKSPGTAVAANPVAITIAGTSIPPSFAGLSSPGLFQFNLTVPTGLGIGDVPLSATVLRASTQNNVVISLR